MLSEFRNWHSAFLALNDAIDLLGGKKKIVIFLDEIPWMATAKSNFLGELDYFWNHVWSDDDRIKLIICGSAASWIIKNVLENRGGLHNRVTLKLPMNSFTLAETKSYLKSRNIKYTNEQVLVTYLCIGGIPYYLRSFEKGYSAIQNINQSCFQRSGTLYDEFHVLFASLFNHHKQHEELIRLIASKREGISRAHIEGILDYKGGSLTRRLQELETAGFVVSFVPWKRERGIYYKVIDEYTLFYLTWIENKAASRISKNIDDQYWENLSKKSAWLAWSGYAFEAICFKHIKQIMKGLNIPDGSDVSSWRYVPEKGAYEDGAQIDLIFNRPDGIVTLCEIKYCRTPFVIDKQYAAVLQKREGIYKKVTKTRKQIFHSMVVSSGLKKTMYSEALIDSYITLDELFE